LQSGVEHSSCSPKVILIAESHDVLRNSLKDLVITELPYASVLTVHSGKEAVRVSLNRRPSVVILDADLPELSGVEAARQIRDNCPDTPIVLIHEEESAEYRNSAIAAGARSYVTKNKIAVELIPVLKMMLTTGSRKEQQKGYI
jgi:DNA-binding NarL/FixJ family response regulator